MTRRQSECFRNLDDPLKIFSLLTVKSCGLVLLFYGAAVASELIFGLWELIFGDWTFLAQLGAAGLLAVVLVYAERHDDEHFVPSAIRYYVSRRSRVLYSGARADTYQGHPFEKLIEARAWRS
jgi:hypothetical protein